jgi:hypothetical protein
MIVQTIKIEPVQITAQEFAQTFLGLFGDEQAEVLKAMAENSAVYKQPWGFKACVISDKLRTMGVDGSVKAFLQTLVELL